MVNFTTAERFYNTYKELDYLDLDNLTRSERLTVVFAKYTLYLSLKYNDYDLGYHETKLLEEALLIQEEKGE